jgi:preprotein translocase subunit SecE
LERNPAVWYANSRQYFADVRAEFKKITWPNQKEYVGGTVGVVIIVAVLTLVLGVIDAVLTWGMEILIG